MLAEYIISPQWRFGELKGNRLDSNILSTYISPIAGPNSGYLGILKKRKKGMSLGWQKRTTE